LGLLRAPCILYNHNGYYEPLRAQLGRMVKEGLSTSERQQGIHFADSVEEIRGILESK